MIVVYQNSSRFFLYPDLVKLGVYYSYLTFTQARVDLHDIFLCEIDPGSRVIPPFLILIYIPRYSHIGKALASNSFHSFCVWFGFDDI